ncbi:MAG: OmpA family protein [Nitrospira sp.]|nr:OmpA family protein [Nitrospira sp.]
MVMKLVTFAFVSTVTIVGTLSSSEAVEIGSGSDLEYPATTFAAPPTPTNGLHVKPDVQIGPHTYKVRDDNPASNKDAGPVQVSKARGEKKPPGQLQQQLLTKEKEIAILRGEVTAATDLLNFEKNRAGALETQFTQLQQELKALRSRGQGHDQLSEELVITRSHLDQARQKIVDLDRQLATSNLEHAKRRIAELDRQVDAKDKEIMVMRTNGEDKDKLKSDLASRTEELKQAEQHFLAQDHELMQAKETLNKVYRRLTDLESQLTTRNAQLEQAKQWLTDLESQLTIRNAQLEQAKQLLVNFQQNEAKEQEVSLSQEPTVADTKPPRPAAIESGQPTTSKEQSSLTQLDAPEASGSDLARLSDDLTHELRAELTGGEVLLRQVGNKVSLELATGELFTPGQAVVTQRGSSLLQRIGAVLQKFRYQTVEVAGHADSKPLRNSLRKIFQDNSKLSWARAQQASRALISGGLQADRVKAVGYAATKPIATNDTEQGRSKNRRVEIIITQWSEPEDNSGDTARRVSKKQRMFSVQRVAHR